MSPTMIRVVVTGAFALHGAGMLGAAGYLPWSMRSGKAPAFVGASWLLGGGTAAIVVGVIVWAVAGIGFVAAAIGFWLGAEWWRAAAWVGAPATLLAIGLWFGAVPIGVYVGGALAVGTIAYLLFW